MHASMHSQTGSVALRNNDLHLTCKRVCNFRKRRECATSAAQQQRDACTHACPRGQNVMQLLPQRLAAAFAAAAFLLTSPTVQASPANTVQEQGDLLTEMLKQNAGKKVKALGPDREKGAFKDFAPQRLVSEAGSSDVALAGPATPADSPVDKVTDQAKGVAKKLQQSTPKGSPTKPQPLQRAGPLEAAKEVTKSGLQLASTEGAFKLQGPVTKGGSQGGAPAGIELPTPKGSKEAGSGPSSIPTPIKRSQFFQSGGSAASSAKAQAQEVGQQGKEKADQAAPSDNFLSKLLSKPEQANSAAADKASSAAAGQAGSAAADKVQETASSNPLSKLLSKPEQLANSATDKAKSAADNAQEAAPSSNPFSKLLSKPEQLANNATDKAKSAATDKAQEAATSSNPFSKLLTKPDQIANKAADKVKSNAPSAASAKGFASKQSSKAKAAADDATPSGNPLSGLFSKPNQALDAAKEAAPAGNPLTNLLSNSGQPAEAAKEAAASSNPFSGLLTKPQQATQEASSKAKQAAAPAASKASGASNPFTALLAKPKQAADKGQSAVKQAGTGAAVAGAAAAAAAAADAVKSNATGSGFDTQLPSPPSLPDASKAVQSASDAGSKLSLPDAPSLTTSGSGLQQAAGVAAAEIVAAVVTLNIVGSLTAKKSGVKAYGKR